MTTRTLQTRRPAAGGRREEDERERRWAKPRTAEYQFRIRSASSRPRVSRDLKIERLPLALETEEFCAIGFGLRSSRRPATIREYLDDYLIPVLLTVCGGALSLLVCLVLKIFLQTH